MEDKDKCLHCNTPITNNHPTMFCGPRCEGGYVKSLEKK